mmetsp:Transcript_117025/g.342757  ORF Transcript_117025/g.342757 Transcript_117025/m.342757 type:complete len:177 (+) Transcript_117025:51-581(+)
MGQGSSTTEKLPERLVPTSTQLRRVQLSSAWWPLQLDGKASVPLCLEAYGKPYASLLEQHCGQHRHEHVRCVRSRKLDPLNMSEWYPACGEHYELENTCAGSLLVEVDRKCRAPLDRAAAALVAAKGNQADPKLKTSLDAVGQCITQITKAKGLDIRYDSAAARERFLASKRLMIR